MLATLAVAFAIAAVASWMWFEQLLAIVLAGFAVAFALLAARSNQASRLVARIDEFIDHRENVLARLSGRMESEGRKASVLIVLTEKHFYLFELHLTPRPAELRLAYANLRSIRMDAPRRPLTLLIELPDRTLAINGLQLQEVTDFERVIAEQRPGLTSGSLAEELRESQAS